MKIRILKLAAEELKSTSQWYEAERSGLGVRFEQAFWRAVELIQSNPRSASFVAPHARRRRVRRFPYGIVYTIKSDHVLIISIMHLHRKPHYWRDRIRDEGV